MIWLREASKWINGTDFLALHSLVLDCKIIAHVLVALYMDPLGE